MCRLIFDYLILIAQFFVLFCMPPSIKEVGLNDTKLEKERRIYLSKCQPVKLVHYFNKIIW